jgi:hypothetical protein
MRTVLALLGAALFVSCSVLILVGWRNPESRFLVGMLQTRHHSSTDPKRTSAAACWLILGLAAGSVGLLLSWESGEGLREATIDDAAGYVSATLLLVCVAMAAYVRFGDAPQAVRPAALRDSSRD